MIEIEISNAEQVTTALQKLAKSVKQRKKVMSDIASLMEAAVLTNFLEGGRPEWLGLKYRDGKPLVDTGNLMASIECYFDNDSAEVGTNEAYAAIHQFGGKAGRGKKVDIPARPFLQLTEQDEQDILDIVQWYFADIV